MRLLKWLNEGGNAIKIASPLHMENFKSTINNIYEKLLPLFNLTYTDIKILGSGGKKNVGDTHGDIDLALPISEILKRNNLDTFENIITFIISQSKKISKEVKYMKGSNIISLAWPIYNMNKKQANLYVQVDLMLVDDVDWADWTYHSPYYYESKWKGLYRNFILFAVARQVEYKTIKKQRLKDGNIIDTEWEKYTIDMTKGLYKVLQTNISKSGNIVKAHRTLEKEFITKDLYKAMEILFGNYFKPSDISSFENILKCINNKKFLYYDKKDEILKKATKDLLDSGLPIPEQLINYK